MDELFVIVRGLDDFASRYWIKTEEGIFPVTLTKDAKGRWSAKKTSPLALPFSHIERNAVKVNTIRIFEE
jgi:hypothetical protein